MTKFRSFDEMTEDPAWEGWGYLNGRTQELNAGHGLSVADADAQVLAHAEAAGWSDADLFAWSNSRLGRWFADAITDPAYRTKHAATLLAKVEVSS